MNPNLVIGRINPKLNEFLCNIYVNVYVMWVLWNYNATEK